MIRTLLIASILLLFAMPADAGQAVNCGDLTGQTDMNICFAGQFHTLDNKLNADYAALMEKLASDTNAVDLERDAERAWIIYRDKECAVEAYPTRGGSVNPTVSSMCLISMTQDRLKLIDDLLHCQEGDLTCIAPGVK